MDYEIEELLDTTRDAVEERRKAESDRAAVDRLRDLDEVICLRSRALYVRYKSTVLMCRRVEESTRDEVGRALREAVQSLPERDYATTEAYKIRQSVEARYSDFEQLTSRMKDDSNRPGWCLVPILQESAQPA